MIFLIPYSIFILYFVFPSLLLYFHLQFQFYFSSCFLFIFIFIFFFYIFFFFLMTYSNFEISKIQFQKPLTILQIIDHFQCIYSYCYTYKNKLSQSKFSKSTKLVPTSSLQNQQKYGDGNMAILKIPVCLNHNSSFDLCKFNDN